MRKLYWTVGTLVVLLVIGCGLLASQIQVVAQVRFVPWGVEWVRQTVHDEGQTLCEESTHLTLTDGLITDGGWYMHRAEEGLPDAEAPVWVPPEEPAPQP